MRKNKLGLSIIIVRFAIENELYRLIDSIQKTTEKISYEVIVVDNNEHDRIKKRLLKKFPNVQCLENKNTGFGDAINKGVEQAHGEYILGLNPDLVVHKGAINELFDFIKSKRAVGLVSPQYVLEDGSQPGLQVGTKRLTPAVGIFALTFLSRFIPKKLVYNKFYILERNRLKNLEVDAVPGGAFMIKKDFFEKLGGFDSKFFLYFEEHDLSNRVKRLGLHNYIVPEAKVYHVGGIDSKNLQSSNVFKQSRFYYFRKHYGLFWAGLVQAFSEFKKGTALLLVILFLAAFLRLYKLSTLMQFIPDQGWIYLSARDMLLTDKIPLVGLNTSHVWLHHGALWTYVLAGIFFVTRFNPVAPAYFMAILGVITVFLFYIVVKKMFSVSVALVSALLYAVSPLIVMNARLPYHTSPIPLFVILLVYLVYVWMKGKSFVFPVIMFLLAVLYNHEITTFVFAISVFFVFAYGLIRKKRWAQKTLQVKIVLLSIVAFIIPMIPFIMYDRTHGYPQTFGFLIWMGYTIVKTPLTLFHLKERTSTTSTVPEFFSYYSELIYPQNLFASLSLLIASVSYFFIKLYKNRTTQNVLLGVFFVVATLGLFTHRAPIEADTLLIVPFFILFLALFLDLLIKNKSLKLIGLFLVLYLACMNVGILLGTNFFTKPGPYFRYPFSEKLEAVQKVILLSNGKPYNIEGKGTLSTFPVFLTPYEYLLWWEGHPVSGKNRETKILIWEKGSHIVVKKLK